ncbi:MAG: YraN family protein [Paludibacteraceae bacterium]|nr:YraN family protein [Paludibacteraceae bacterium]
MAQHNYLGAAGEAAACAYLTHKGYTIRHCNWRCGHLEIDIVAETPDRLIVIEVKTRASLRFAHPLEAVGWSKMQRLVNAAQAYIFHYNIQKEIQFDLMALTPDPDGGFLIEHVPDAFLPPLC